MALQDFAAGFDKLLVPFKERKAGKIVLFPDKKELDEAMKRK